MIRLLASGGERARANFRIVGETIDLDRITQVLGLIPSRVQRRGELVGRGTSIRSESSWHLSSTLEESAPLADHLLQLVVTLEPRAAALPLATRDAQIASLFCFYEARAGFGSVLTLPPELLGRISALGVPLQIDVYPLDEAESE